MTSWDKKMRKQDNAAGKRKFVTLISQKLEIIRRLKRRKSQSVVTSTVCDIKKQEDQLQSSVASSVKCESSFEVTDFEVFLISNFCRVLCVVCFLLGNYPKENTRL